MKQRKGEGGTAKDTQMVQIVHEQGRVSDEMPDAEGLSPCRAWAYWCCNGRHSQ